MRAHARHHATHGLGQDPLSEHARGTRVLLTLVAALPQLDGNDFSRHLCFQSIPARRCLFLGHAPTRIMGFPRSVS